MLRDFRESKAHGASGVSSACLEDAEVLLDAALRGRELRLEARDQGLLRGLREARELPGVRDHACQGCRAGPAVGRVGSVGVVQCA